MTCKELAELLMSYCDGELTQECCDLICQHIRLCGPCLHFMESYQITVRMCRELPKAEVPPHLVERFLASMKQQGPGPCADGHAPLS
jgi:hypothetical protein